MFNTNSIQYNGVTVRFEVITPEMAQNILDDTAAGFASDETKDYQQRRVRTGTVNIYSKDMKNDKWVINGATIVFDNKDRCMDGQHRLRSIVKSGVPQICLVVRGVDNSAMSTIDCGLKRSLENYLQFQAESYTNGSAGVVKVKVLLDKHKMEVDQSNGNLNTTNTDYVEEYMNNEDMFKEAVNFANGIHKARKNFRVAEVGGIYTHLVHTKGFDKDVVKNFFLRLSTVSLDENTIYRRLYENLGKMPKGGKKRIQEYIKCWNAFVKGTKNLAPIDENSWFLTPKPYYEEIA